MLVERKTPAGWQTIATDGDWNTRVRWRAEDESIIAKLSWETSAKIEAGAYRLTHLGHDQLGDAFRGISLEINIK